jgi:thiol-disulfide isomerase/thioredoxin
MAPSDVDAPTTLPTSARATCVTRIGGIVTAPRATLESLTRGDDGHPLEPFLVYALVVISLHGAETYRLLSLVSEAPLIAARRLFDVVLRAGRTDLVIVVGAAAVVALIAALQRRRPLGAALATTYLLVPLALLKAVGGLLSVAGLELWMMPHHAVDSMAVVVGGKVDYQRMTIKCVVAYGSGVITLAAWLFGPKAIAPRAVVGRVGAAIVVAVVGAGIVASSATVAQRRESLRPLLSGDTFPVQELPHLNGGGRSAPTAAIDDKRAKVVLVDFWASWCGPCKRSLPELSALSESHKGQGLVVVGVNREPRDRPAARQAWQDFGPSFDSLIDNVGLGERLGLTSLPTSYIVDAKGVIRHVHLGYTEIDVVRAEVEALLKESP